MSRYPHLEGCKCGDGGKVLDKQNPWWVNAPEYSNCFWTYMRHNTRQHTLNEVAKLLNLSISAITSTERSAFKKLKRKTRLLQFIKN